MAVGCLLLTLAFVVLPGVLCIRPGDYDPKRGTYVGLLSTLEHKVRGKVYAVDNITIYIEGFNYDGEAPDAYFFAGNKGETPSNRGFIIPTKKEKSYPLGPYNGASIVLRFPITKKGQRGFFDIMWISVWCRKFGIDFGHVTLPKGLKTPSPAEGGELISNDIPLKAKMVMLMDTETIKLEDFTYDGSIKDAIFVMGSGERDASGHQVMDEKGSRENLKKYTRKTLELKIPKEAVGKPVQYFGVWSPTKGMMSSVVFPTGMRIPPHPNQI